VTLLGVFYEGKRTPYMEIRSVRPSVCLRLVSETKYAARLYEIWYEFFIKIMKQCEVLENRLSESHIYLRAPQ
jgi:hypothetical protein